MSWTDCWSSSLCSDVAGLTHATINHVFLLHQPYSRGEYRPGSFRRTPRVAASSCCRQGRRNVAARSLLRCGNCSTCSTAESGLLRASYGIKFCHRDYQPYACKKPVCSQQNKLTGSKTSLKDLLFSSRKTSVGHHWAALPAHSNQQESNAEFNGARIFLVTFPLLQ